MIKWLKRIVIFLVVLIGIIVLAIELNKKAIIKKVVDSANAGLTTPITYNSADVSFLSTFPSLGVQLEDVSIDGEKDGVPALLDLGKFQVTLNIIEALQNKEAYTIKKLTLADGTITAYTDADGTTNYDITKESSESSGSSNVSLEGLDLDHVNLRYIDHQSNTAISLDDINADGSIDYINENVDVDINYETIVDGGFINDHLNLSGSGSINLTDNMTQLSFKELKTSINDLPIYASGSVGLEPSDEYEISISSPETEVKKLASLLNVFYENEYRALKSSGTYDLVGTLSGNSAGSYPLYDIALKLKDGSLSYPSLPKSIDKLDLDIALNNTAQTRAFTDIAINNLNLATGENYLKGLGNIKSQPGGYAVDVDSDFELNLGDLKEALPLEEGTELAGIFDGRLAINTAVNESLGLLNDGEELFNIDLIGRDINYNDGVEAYQIEEVTVEGSGASINYKLQAANLSFAQGLDVSGSLNKPLSLLSDQEATAGVLNVGIAKIDYIDEGAEELESVNNSYPIPKINLIAQLDIEEIYYETYSVQGLSGTGNITDAISTLEFTADGVNGNIITGKGNLDQLLQYGLNGDTLSGGLTLYSPDLNLDSFISDDTTSTDGVTELLPDNIDLTISYDVGKASLFGIDLTKALGDLNVAGDKVTMSQRAKFFDGDIVLSGQIDDFVDGVGGVIVDVDVKDVSLSKSAEKIKLINMILPLSKYIQGDFDMVFELKTNIDANYVPDLNSISAFGELTTQDGSINGFAPIDTFLSFIQGSTIDKTWEVENLSRYFLVENGRVVVKEMSLKRDDIQLSYEGTHGFNQDIDYHVTMSLPSSKFNMQKGVSLLANKGILSDQLATLTEDVRVEIDAYVSGNMLKPQVKLTDIAIAKGGLRESITEKITETVQDKKEEVEQTVRDTIDTIKEDIKASRDSAKQVIVSEIDSSKKQIEGQVNTIIDSLKAGNVDSLSSKINEIFKGQENKIDKIKDKIKIPLFKKKTGN
jgi:hypothetical protein